MDPLSEKNYLRNFFLQKRYLLSKEEFKGLSDALLNNFMNINFSKIKVINTFLGTVSKGEPNTLLFIDKLRKNYPKTIITVPKINFHDLSLDNILLKKDSKLVINKWKISEPIESIYIDKQLIDCMLVPLLCIDKRGYRIGYGKGFYDKFIKECRDDIQTIGISLFEPVNKIEEEPHDIKLTTCITPSEIIYF